MAFANTGWNPKNASWGCTTETKQLAEGLTSLSTWPSAGEVEDKKNNPAMEKFRKAQNVVYDIFNNGLGNRAYQCRHALDGLTKAELAFATYINGRFCYPANHSFGTGQGLGGSMPKSMVCPCWQVHIAMPLRSLPRLQDETHAGWESLSGLPDAQQVDALVHPRQGRSSHASSHR